PRTIAPPTTRNPMTTRLVWWWPARGAGVTTWPGLTGCAIVGGMLIGGGKLDVVVLLPVTPACAVFGPPVPSPSVGSAKAGVGSKGSQPNPSIHTSGHACALRLVTWYRPSLPSVPGW